MLQDISYAGRLAFLHYGALLLGGAALACPAPAHGQGEPSLEEQDDEENVIVVIGTRPGAAEIASEDELDEEEIASHGAGTIDELIEEIAPRVGDPEDRPEVLVNGERVSDTKSLSRFPPEALERVEILPQRAAGHYGFDQERRVINLVTRRQFRMTFVTAGLTLPTRGGPDSENVTAASFAIDGESRWSVEGGLSRASGLLERDRRVSPPSGRGSIAGNLYATSAELDPELSALAGFPVASTGVPPEADSGMVPLAGFVEFAGQPHPRDDAAWRSLRAATKGATLKFNYRRPLGGAALNIGLAAGRQRSHRLAGLAEASLPLLAGSPFSPFANDATLERLLADAGPLAATQETSNIGLTLGLEASFGKQSASLGLAIERSEANGKTDRGFDFADLRSRLLAGDPTLNPFGALPLGRRVSDTTDSINDSLSLTGSVNGPVIELPAGRLSWTFSGSYARRSSRTDFEGSGTTRTERSGSDTGNARLGLNIPIASARNSFLAVLGELRLQLNTGISVTGGESARLRAGGAVNWQPASFVGLNAALAIEAVEPSAEQVGAPILETAGVRVYDYTRGELAEVIQISGGNPALVGGSNRNFSLGARLTPFGRRGVSLAIDYRRKEQRGGVGALPALTPAVEAAFPDRVLRDAEGRILRVDLRPINLAQNLTESIDTRILWNHRFGSEPQENASRPGEAGASPPARSSTAQAPPGFGRGGWGGPRGGGFPGRPGGTFLSVSLTHSWQLANRLLIREGVPRLDRLDGEGGGQSRHRLGLSAMAGRSGMGLRLGFDWKSAYVTRVGGSEGDLHFGAEATASLGLNLDLGRLAPAGKRKWLDKTHLSLDVDNLFDARQRVTRDDGSVADGYLPDDIDPIGRTVRLTLRRPL